MGLLQSIGHGLENLGLAVEGTILEAECAVKNAAIDIKTDAKVRKYQKERMATGYTLDEEDIENIEEDEKEMKFYEEMFEKLAYCNQFKGKPNKTNWLRAVLEAGDLDEDDDDEAEEDD